MSSGDAPPKPPSSSAGPTHPGGRDAALLAALARLAAQVQRARTEDEVLATLGDGLLALGLQSAALKLEGPLVRHAHPGLRPEVQHRLEQLMKGPLASFTVPLEKLELLSRTLADGRSVYCDLYAGFDAVFAHLSADERATLATHAEALGLRQGVLAPLYVHGRPWGALLISSTELSPSDGAALGLFASQASSALESAAVIADLERKNRHLAAIHAVAAAGSGTDLASAYSDFARSAAEATGSDAAALFLLEAKASELRLVGAHGRGIDLGGKYGRIPLAGSATGQAALSMRPRSLNVARDWPEASRADLLARGIVEAAVVPLRVKDRLCGTLNLTRNSPAPFSEDELTAAEMVAGQIAVQIENARLHLEEKRRVRQLSLLFNLSRTASEATEVAPLLERVLDEVVSALAVDAGTIRLLEDERLVLAASRGLPVDERACPSDRGGQVSPACACGQAARERQTATAGASCPGAGATSSVAVTPLIANDRLIGTFCVVRRGGSPLGEDEVRLLESCGGQIGVAIEHARHLEEERRRVRDLALINQLGELVSQHLELPAVLSAGVRHLSRITDAPNAFLLLLEPDALRLVATNLDAPELACLAFPRSELITEWLKGLPAAGPLILHDPLAEKDPAASVELIERYAPRGMLVAPLVSKGEAIGIIVLGENRPGRRFSSYEGDRAVAVANQLASAISNAQLYETERQRAEQFRLLHDVGRAITASLDLEETLVAAATTIARMVAASSVFIWLRDPLTNLLVGAATSAPQFREHFLTRRLALDEISLATLSMRKRAPVWTTDTLVSEEVYRELCERYGAGSLMAIPLLLRDEAIGAVVITDARRGRPWNEAEVERATIIARQVAVAVANARLFDDLKHSYDELARTQETLVKRERLAALGELAAVVAHEVRNPLGVIFNSLGALKRAPPASGEAKLLLHMLGEEADRLNRIVGGLLDFARPHEPSLEPEPLEAVLAGAIEAASASTCEGDPVQVHLEIAGPLERAWVDRRMLRQALVNLVENAVQATPANGQVEVRASAEGGDAGRPLVRIEVSDRGPGVPPELAERIFQPFFTTKATGTGLGLAVVKRIVEAHRGEISVSQTPGGGATFTLRLPRDPPPAAQRAGG